MRVERTLITPEMASSLLKLNTENFRRPDPKRVSQYASEIKRGRWVENGETIKLNGKVLMDGQHRLMAVVQAGVAVWMLVVYDIKANAAAIDRGKPRSVASWLNHEGVKNATTVASAARLIIAYQKGFWTTHAQLTHATDSELIDFVMSNNDRLQSAVTLARKGAPIVTPSQLAAVVFCGTREDMLPEQSRTATWFCASLSSGADLSKTDAVLYLRNKFVDMKGKSFIPVVSRAYITLAWNKTVEGTPVNSTSLRITMTGPTKTKLPEVILVSED